MITVRRAELRDAQDVVRMGADMAAEAPSHTGLEFKQESALRTFVSMINDKNALVLVAEHDGEVIGMFAGVCLDHWCFAGKTASDLVLYVRSGRRGGLAGLRLVQSYVKWARDRGALRAYLSTSTGIEAERFAALFERTGFERVGYGLQLRLND